MKNWVVDVKCYFSPIIGR